MILDPLHQQMRDLFRAELELRVAGKPDEAKAAGAGIDAMLNKCASECCDQCGDIFCPWGEALHFHHDGCPCCATVQDWNPYVADRNLLARNK